MKRFLSTLTLLLCFAFTAVNAQVITAERAAEIANSFFSAGVQKSAAARGVVSSPSLTSSFDSNDVTETASAEPTFYVLTNPEGGFVIVSGEETENPIIGYSLDGTIDVNNLPDGFVGYMTDIDAQVKSLREYNTNNPQKAAAARSAMQRAANYEYNATTMGNIVKNLNTAPWGQRTPFNKLCPVVGTGNAVTGCVPTAYSILCRYYEWPEQGVGTVYNPSTGDPLQLGHTYDYASMRNDNYPSGYTDAEATAVATLMRDMGYAYTASYGSGTTTTSSENPSNLIKYFGFKCETPLDHGNGCTKYDIVNNMEQWVTYIKNCLNAGYPIPYSSTTALDAQDRHIYILDGYTDNNYFHFNWGWFGSGNGWFTLDNMVPDDYSNYSKSHRAYFNVIPDKTTYTVTATANDSNMGTVSINGGTVGTTASAEINEDFTATLTAHPAQGFALANWTKNGVVVGTKNTLKVKVGASDNDYVANFEPIENATAGTYYRIAYDFEAPVAAKTAATRAVGDVQTYVVSTSTGSFSNDTIWTSTLNNNPAGLKMLATTNNGKTIASIIPYSTNEYHNFCLKAGGTLGSTDYYSTTYTLSVAPGFKITGYEMTYYPSNDGKVTLTTDFGYTKTPESSLNNYVVRSSDYEFTESEETKFVVSTSAGKLGYSIRIVNFEVYIQEVGGSETPETVRYYMQSVACGVSGGNNLQNALKMTQETGAASIFYYAGNKLLSYDKGTYIKEDGGTRGLQAVGAYGDANIKVVGTNDEDENICTVAAPNYMHANSNGTTYYVDHCGSNPDNHAANHNFVLEEVISLPVTITDAGYATWYAPVAVSLPNGIKAWYFEGNITKVGDVRYAIMAQIGGNVVPANTGVILEGPAGNYELEITETETEIEGNLLKGTVAAEILPNESAYVLSTDKGTRELGFYMANDGQASWSHKAYLPKSAIPADAQMSAGFRLILPGTTVIEEVETENNIDAIYDLTGRKLEGISGTGIYIINGKKVLIK